VVIYGNIVQYERNEKIQLKENMLSDNWVISKVSSEGNNKSKIVKFSKKFVYGNDP
jgi:hypothetical protein